MISISCTIFILANLLYSFRTPTDFTWKQRWNEALSKQKISRGNLVCINHFSSTDYEIKNQKTTLKSLAIPTIFGADCDNDADVEVDYSEPIEKCTNDRMEPCRQCENFREQITTLISRCSDLEKQRERNEALLNQKIQSQSAQINKLIQMNKSQLKEISSLKKNNEDQSDEIKRMSAELNGSKTQSKLIQFVLNANSPKV